MNAEQAVQAIGDACVQLMNTDRDSSVTKESAEIAFRKALDGMNYYALRWAFARLATAVADRNRGK